MGFYPQFLVDDDPHNDPLPGDPTPLPTPAGPSSGGGSPDATTGQPGAPTPPPTEDPVRGRNRGGGNEGYPGMNGPTFNLPNAPTFNGPQFNRPTMDDAYNEPGYQFRARAGQDALERSAAARGVLRTGGTLKDLVEYGQNFAANEYGQVFNRAAQAHDRAYRNAYDAFAPQLAAYQNRARAEMLRGQMAYDREWNAYTFARRNQGGGGGGGTPLEGPPKYDPRIDLNEDPIGGGGRGYTPRGPFDQPQTPPGYGGGATAFGSGGDDDPYYRYY